ncbi:MAG: aminomethyl-transferring glycine dehydrogenase, partial [Marmoricola sp.]
MSDQILGNGLQPRPFSERHIGPDDHQVTEMLKKLGLSSLEALMDDAVPGRIRSDGLGLPPAVSERAAAAELREIAALNNPLLAMIGLGYHGTVTPPVVRRNVLEDPSWYTAYTPYQPEISQGRLEALLNFQTMVSDLTGLTTSNASLLDEGTAAAEAMTLVRRAGKKTGPFVVDADALPQTIEVVRTRAEAMGIEVVVADLADGLPGGDLSGVLVQYPGASGRILDPRTVIEETHERGGLAVVAADLLALTLLESPGTLGADVAVGSSQRFGVPLFYGGPHAGFMSVRSGLERHLPGRLVGVSVDSAGRPAYRLSLQTREQHIRRDRATSNICTAQVLLAVVASMYAVYHGPDGLRQIAAATHHHAHRLAALLRRGGVEVVHDDFFDTVLARVPGRAEEVVAAARQSGVHLRLVDADHVGVSTSETTDLEVVDVVATAFGVGTEDVLVEADLPASLRRTTDYLTHEVFNTHRSETSMLRYLRRLSARDYALDRGMIPLGSCTMKLNATTEMEPVSLPGFADLHPFAPAEDALGYRRLIDQLESWLADVTGYDRVSIQPNAGSQGELAGLLAIRGYHRANGEGERNVCLIPSSAHGTNAASAVMAGMKVVVVKSAEDGSVDMDDLRQQCDAHSDDLAAIMVTYPSTHGAYEDTISDLCETVHAAGGQVYVDGANLNALLGYAKPGEFGGDVSHLNLHKTFCIPHGGGGPGVGPVGVREHLAPYLPSHGMHPEAGKRSGIGPISAAPYGSAGILPISWAYVRMMGPDGLADATGAALLTANYVAKRLGAHYPVLYTGQSGL